jgi:DNA invertase Pin-like site-specific DNA recombinase
MAMERRQRSRAAAEFERNMIAERTKNGAG